jgi:transcription-repair coupling factor (superfamily II helicase)
LTLNIASFMALSSISSKLGPRFKPVADAIRTPGAKIRADKVIGSALSFLLSAIDDRKSLTLVVAQSQDEAQYIKTDLESLGLENVYHFPPSNAKPYDNEQVRDLHAAVRRTEVMELLAAGHVRWLITSPDAIYDQIPDPGKVASTSLGIHRNAVLSPERALDFLGNAGYSQVSFAENPGEYARRGGIIDVFPYNTDYPVRIEFFGDEVDSIREFDSGTQRSVSFLDQIRIVPAIIFKRDMYEPITRHLPGDTRIVLAQPDAIIADFHKLYGQAEAAYHSDVHADALSDLYVSPETFAAECERFTLLEINGVINRHLERVTIDIGSQPHPEFNGSIKLLRQQVEQNTAAGTETVILCDNEGQRDRFEELLGEPGQNLNYRLMLDRLWKGFVMPEQQMAIYTDHQIYNRYYRPQARKVRRGGISQKELRDLHIGDFVVHVDFGIGRFEGFKTIKVRDIPQESVVLRYAEDSLMYVNVSSLHKLQKYSGKEGGEPQVTKLGTGEWARKKAKTKSRLKDIARELILLYAKRKAQQAFAFAPDHPWQTEMEASFMYEETPDQMGAIEAVKEDMEKSTPMDRLVCGDVGFGKTEVAVRAAFKAVMNQKQVAILVPTTILADQHAKTFRSRMQDFPVRVEVLSRFRTAAEITEVLKQLKQGKVDIIIGTHRLVSKDVVFKDLGLLVIDEEQRFGVATKEKLKEWRYSMDVLTLTATPIPRTLQMSLMGARDLSVITTPPPNRQPVYTEIHSFDPYMIRDAILKETSRGGQVFFIHNRVQNIEEVAAMVREFVPDIRVRYAHGQMTGAELENIITDFYGHRFDVLISTNIVENGIDISNANTIIINRADRFGLSELHQLRGRVGRSNRKAFCYLITPPLQDLSTEARRRLQSLVEYSDLGSGFHIAMRDLDIRGAGDILGAEQSGFINEIGIELYTKILNEAVQELKETEFKDLFKDLPVQVALPETQVEMDLPAQLPKRYVADDVERLNLYRKIAGAEDVSELDKVQDELVDRFGAMPEDAVNLLLAATVRILAARQQFLKVTVRMGRMWLQCPNANTETDYYKGGHFQQLMDTLESVAKGAFSLAQKEQAVRIVVNNIDGLDGAIAFLQKLSKSEVHAETIA